MIFFAFLLTTLPVFLINSINWFPRFLKTNLSISTFNMQTFYQLYFTLLYFKNYILFSPPFPFPFEFNQTEFIEPGNFPNITYLSWMLDYHSAPPTYSTSPSHWLVRRCGRAGTARPNPLPTWPPAIHTCSTPRAYWLRSTELPWASHTSPWRPGHRRIRTRSCDGWDVQCRRSAKAQTAWKAKKKKKNVFHQFFMSAQNYV